jgi:hypothetical protein
MFKNCDLAGSGSALMLTVDISEGEIYIFTVIITAIVSCNTYKHSWYRAFR